LWIPYAGRNAFDICLPNFLESLDDPKRSPHPVVINAICLIGSYYSGCSFVRDGGRWLDFTGLERILIERVRTALLQCLADADPLYPFIIASFHLATYLALKGRMMEAQLEIFTACRFAISCGLNRFFPSSTFESTPLSTSENSAILLECSSDPVEMWERVNLFWALYLVDLSFFIIAGYPVAIPDGVSSPFVQTTPRLTFK
jgi:hypothetical protein